MGAKCSQSLLIFAKVQLQEACIAHKRKLEHTKKAYEDKNQINSNETREQESNIREFEDTKAKYKWREKVKMGMHNINRLKGDMTKLDRLVEYCKEEHFNLVGISETNINEKEGE